MRSLDDPALRHNLPSQPAGFVGRTTELAELRSLVSGGSRLVTIAGPGGIGKSRLALRVAAEVLDGAGDGVWLVELAPVADPALVARTVAAVLAVREEPGRFMLDTLLDAIGDRYLLVLLDNAEHVLDAAAKLADAVLRFCPRAGLLVTSREPLAVGGEHVFRLGSLAVPPADLAAPGRLAAVESVQLFVQRAAMYRQDFALEPARPGRGRLAGPAGGRVRQHPRRAGVQRRRSGRCAGRPAPGVGAALVLQPARARRRGARGTPRPARPARHEDANPDPRPGARRELPPAQQLRRGTITLANLGVPELEAGELRAARAHLQEAGMLADDLGYRQVSAALQENMGFVELIDGDPARARRHFFDSLDTARTTGLRPHVRGSLLGLALAAGADGDPAVAAALHGVADKHFEEGGRGLAAIEVGLRDRDHAQLRARLGDAAFEAAYARGRTLGQGDAIALAIEGQPAEAVPASAGPLSQREREILALLAVGASDAQIAGRLFLSVNTVRSHLERIRDNTGARRRPDLVRYAIGAGIAAPR